MAALYAMTDPTTPTVDLPRDERRITAGQQRMIHRMRTDLRLDDEQYRTILRECAGVESSSELTWRGVDAVKARLIELSALPAAPPSSG